MAALEIHRTRTGKGIVACRLFRAGAVIYRVRGTVMSGAQLNRAGGSVQDNAFRFSAGNYLSPQGEIGDFQNHSCEPSARVTKRRGGLVVIAIVPIPAGTEVLIDYSTILARNDDWEMLCRCGAKKCRRIIRKFTSLPPELKAGYISRGIIPPYILKLRSYRR